MNQAAIFFVKSVSFFFKALGFRACRFFPTCSEYSAQAFNHFGFFKASLLTLQRIFRCHPFCEGGVDLLPTQRLR